MYSTLHYFWSVISQFIHSTWQDHLKYSLYHSQIFKTDHSQIPKMDPWKWIIVQEEWQCMYRSIYWHRLCWKYRWWDVYIWVLHIYKRKPRELQKQKKRMCWLGVLKLSSKLLHKRYVNWTVSKRFDDCVQPTNKVILMLQSSSHHFS